MDGLKPSKYLIDTAIKNIEGDISIDEAQELLNTYYEENPKADAEEADKVAVRIAKILSGKAFSFTPNEYISIHKKLFTGIYGHAGKLRDYNITKKEWVLNGATVLYGSASELHNRSMHISGMFEEADIESAKADIENVKSATAGGISISLRCQKQWLIGFAFHLDNKSYLWDYLLFSQYYFSKMSVNCLGSV